MERRAFSKKQKDALLLWSLGKCSICGITLDKSFHADHIKPYSKDGKTDVTNGQALCAACNLKKGSKMIKLREWQEDAKEHSVEQFEKGNKFFLAQATPGGGKTIFALSVFNEMKKLGLVTHCIVVAPSSNLVKQWTSESSSLFNLQLKNGMLYNQMPDFKDYRGVCITYQAMNEIPDHLRMFCEHNKTLVIADEMHHVADGQSWGAAFQTAFSESQNILGLTGTPWASEGKTIPFVEYDNNGYAKPDFRYGKDKAIKDKVCRIAQFHKMQPKNLSFSDKETGEFLGTFGTLEHAIESNVKGAYLKTLQSTKHMLRMFEEANNDITVLRKCGRYSAGGLLVAPNIKTANAFKDEIFRITGEDYPIVHSKMDKPHKKIEEFKKSNVRWLISVDMITEGIDIKRLQTCVFLSHKNTELFVRQVCGRIERIVAPDNVYDRSATFYYTDTPELNELIIGLENENEAGIKLSEEESEKKDQGSDKQQGDERPEDFVSLEELETESNGLIARGLTYELSVVKEAIKKRRRSEYLQDVELFVVCKFVLSEREAKKEIDAEVAFAHDMPMAEKKENMRRGITERLNKKLAGHYNRIPIGDEIKSAHRNINKRIGIKNTTDSIGYDQLLTKFDYICQTDAEAWL